jgi:hypothetical protein
MRKKKSDFDMSSPFKRYVIAIKEGMKKGNYIFQTLGKGGYRIRFHNSGYDVIYNSQFRDIEIWEHTSSGIPNPDRRLLISLEEIKILLLGYSDMCRAHGLTSARAGQSVKVFSQAKRKEIQSRLLELLVAA